MNSAKELFEIERTVGKYAHPKDISWISYQETNLLIPNPPPRYLFRGQSSVFQPSRASLFRGLDWTQGPRVGNLCIEDRAKLVARLSQTYWFAAELENHYFYSDLKSKGWPLDPIGLAQHTIW